MRQIGKRAPVFFFREPVSQNSSGFARLALIPMAPIVIGDQALRNSATFPKEENLRERPAIRIGFSSWKNSRSANGLGL